jgi:hypothetical protein
MSVLPDAEALLIAALAAQTAIATPVGGRISTRLSGTYPAIRVTLLGGVGRIVDGTLEADVQWEVWGDDSPTAETVASDIARAIEAAVPLLAGVYGPGTIRGASSSGYIIHSPDSVTARERYLGTATVLAQ